MRFAKEKHVRVFDVDKAPDQLLADIRREGTLQQYKRTAEENKMLEAWRVAEKARNMQIEYAQLAEAVNRMPVALQRGVLERMHALGGALGLARRAYPKNFPRGFDPKPEIL